MTAHVAGLPVEEALVPLVSGLGGGLVVLRAWIVPHLRNPGRRRSRSTPSRSQR